MALIKQGKRKMEERLTARRMKAEQEAAILDGVNEQQGAARTQLQHGVWKELKLRLVNSTFQQWR